ncbi:MAG TPA: phosphoribosylamine--glycine ligase [Candidatus Kapabacteria bacterium]|nr:phosphoribosylamine--glycine ligase [Candidatus Kapabacteria bacterium]
MKKINTLVIGSGGRENALTHKISLSESCGQLYICSGNPGTSKIAINMSINLSNYYDIIRFCKSRDIGLVVVGPEQYLAEGIADKLRLEGINVFGPSMEASKLETSKEYAKNIMRQAGVPTANYQVFNINEYHEAIRYLKEQLYPIVIKADGLAAGKGVVIANNIGEAENTVDEFFSGKFGESSKKIIIEEFMKGDEASIFAICDGKDYFVLPASQDHKKINDGEMGKNTGGMGSYCPTPLVNSEMMSKIEELVIKPMVKQMEINGTPFIGCLYAGLMITPDKEPKVVEFNVRFGDPETQAVLNVIEGDFLKLLYSASIGEIDKNAVKQVDNSFAVCLVLASKGYPDNFEKGFEIQGLAEAESVATIYHAGTIYDNGVIRTNGGRVLNVVAIDTNLFDAITKVYKAASFISYENKYNRNDIAVKGIQYLEW